MKRVYPVILSCLLIAFSFYYTNKVAGIVRGKDPIMQSIKEEKANYEKKKKKISQAVLCAALRSLLESSRIHCLNCTALM